MGKLISIETIQNAYAYEGYLDLIENLLSQNLTTGEVHTPEKLEITRLNLHRMFRITKTAKLDEELVRKINRIRQTVTWLVITEAWCGDAAQILPYLDAMARVNEQIHLRIILRDENPGIMDGFLTNGARAIPKLICLDSELDLIGSWGPRPEVAQKMVLNYKANPVKPKKEFDQDLHLWYGRDRGQSLQHEFKSILDQCARIPETTD